jgi:hypothetical protein
VIEPIAGWLSALHPIDEDLSLGTPALHPIDEDLSLGTPALHPIDEDLSLGTSALIAQAAQAGGVGGRVGQDGSAFASGDLLVGIEAEDG